MYIPPQKGYVKKPKLTVPWAEIKPDDSASIMAETFEQESGIDEWSLSHHRKDKRTIPSLTSSKKATKRINDSLKTPSFSIGEVSQANLIFQNSVNSISDRRNTVKPNLSISQQKLKAINPFKNSRLSKTRSKNTDQEWEILKPDESWTEIEYVVEEFEPSIEDINEKVLLQSSNPKIHHVDLCTSDLSSIK